jgi:hypothetical protein
MADRYWIGGSGNWSDTAHWSDTSSWGLYPEEGVGGFSYPIDGDCAFFEGSYFEDAIISFDVDIVCDTIYGLEKLKDYPLIIDSNGKNVTCCSGLWSEFHIGSVCIKELSIIDSIFFINIFIIEGIVNVFATGSSINLKSLPGESSLPAYFSSTEGGIFNDINFDFADIDDCDVKLIYQDDITFNNVTVTPTSNLNPNIYIGNSAGIEGKKLTCNNWALSGDADTNFIINLNSADYFWVISS